MTQRSYSNERYRKDAKIGSTRKSAAKAKPKRAQGSAEVSAVKPKVKPAVEKDWAGLPTSPKIRKWRRIWWAMLLGGLALIGTSYFIPEFRRNEDVARVVSLVVLALSMAAVTIDLVVIRRLRKGLLASLGKKTGKSGTRAEEPAGKKSGKETS
ncbi:MAG: hypothetical protein ACYC6J_05365 [Coriobacteriia bacterium]